MTVIDTSPRADSTPLLERLANAFAFRGITAALRKRRAAQDAREILERIMPSRPQVARHQRSAALHVQLANEIGWQGSRFRHPQSWRGHH